MTIYQVGGEPLDHEANEKMLAEIREKTEEFKNHDRFVVESEDRQGNVIGYELAINLAADLIREQMNIEDREKAEVDITAALFDESGTMIGSPTININYSRS